MKRKIEPEQLDAAALAIVVVPQLRAGITSIDTKQPESVIGKSPSLPFSYPSVLKRLRNRIAQATGHDIWETVLDMVKNVSEAMLSSLPNFWRIAKEYMDGKYKKVRQRLIHVSISPD